MKRGSLLFGLSAILGMLGCGGSAGADLCTQATQCLAGNEKDEAACVSEFEGSAAAAADYGCTDQFAALSTCHTAKSKCETDNNHKQYTTRDPQSGDDRCDTEQHNLNDCINGASSKDD